MLVLSMSLESGIGSGGREARLVQFSRYSAGQRELDLAIMELFDVGPSSDHGILCTCCEYRSFIWW